MKTRWIVVGLTVSFLLFVNNFPTGSCEQNQRCPNGKYGHSCMLNCSANCDVPKHNTKIIGPCDKITGRCLVACKPGFHGNKCDKKCTKHCATCVQPNGRCMRCDTGYMKNGSFCITESGTEHLLNAIISYSKDSDDNSHHLLTLMYVVAGLSFIILGCVSVPVSITIYTCIVERKRKSEEQIDTLRELMNQNDKNLP